jgi:hypothetical protein
LLILLTFIASAVFFYMWPLMLREWAITEKSYLWARFAVIAWVGTADLLIWLWVFKLAGYW